MRICSGWNGILGEGTVDFWFRSLVVDLGVLLAVARLRVGLVDDLGELLGSQLRCVSVLRT